MLHDPNVHTRGSGPDMDTNKSLKKEVHIDGKGLFVLFLPPMKVSTKTTIIVRGMVKVHGRYVVRDTISYNN